LLAFAASSPTLPVSRPSNRIEMLTPRRIFLLAVCQQVSLLKFDSIALRSLLAVLVGMFFMMDAMTFGAPVLSTGVRLGLRGATLDGVDSGEILLGELNCVACHQAGEAIKARLASKKPPLLGDVGARATPQYLRAFLSNPQ